MEKTRTSIVTNYRVYIWQYRIKCIREENLEKSRVNGDYGEGFMKENLTRALVYMGRMVRRENNVPSKRNSQVYLVKVLKCISLERI